MDSEVNMDSEFNKEVYKSTPEVINVSQAAALLGVHINTIRRWANDGYISSERFGKRRDRRFNKDKLLRDVLNIKVIDGKKEAYSKYYDYLKDLWKRAIQKNAVQSVYTALQVSGVHYGHWDPTIEIQDFFNDFNQLLSEASKKHEEKRVYRIGLIMYCHALEMSFPLSTLANLLLIVGGKDYRIDPFFELWKRKKGTIFDARPPSLKEKIRVIKKLAEEAGESKLAAFIDEYFNDKVRNAFYHSDYCLTDEEFRFSDGGIATSLPLAKIDSIIMCSFAFYEAFFHTHSWAKKFIGAAKKYHKWPNYEVFEILKNDQDELCGFKVHFSNGQTAKFLRQPEKVEAVNLMFEHDGSVNYFVGSIDQLTKQWLVDGKPYEES